MSTSKSSRLFLERKKFTDRRDPNATYRMRTLRSHNRPSVTPPALQPEDAVVERVVTIPDKERQRYVDE